MLGLRMHARKIAVVFGLTAIIDINAALAESKPLARSLTLQAKEPSLSTSVAYVSRSRTRRKLSREDMEALAKVLGPHTVELFQGNKTATDKQKKEQEKECSVEAMLERSRNSPALKINSMPALKISPKSNFKNDKEDCEVLEIASSAAELLTVVGAVTPSTQSKPLLVQEETSPHVAIKLSPRLSQNFVEPQQIQLQQSPQVRQQAYKQEDQKQEFKTTKKNSKKMFCCCSVQ
jgi:hypothetical protein